MSIKQFDIWIADLNPRIGSEAGKRRPVLIVQTDLLNKISHPSTLVCPLTTNIQKGSTLLRVHVKKGMSNLNQDCDVMIDQVRAIDNQRLVKKIGVIPAKLRNKIVSNMAIVFDMI